MTLTYNFKLNQINTVAKEVLAKIQSKTIIFHGDMASGKTTFIKALVNVMSKNNLVNSPTFSIVNEYDLGSDLVYHFDLYRIKNTAEALDFGIEDYLDSANWKFIEWPDTVVDLINEDYDIIEITVNPDFSRNLKLKFTGKNTPIQLNNS